MHSKNILPILLGSIFLLSCQRGSPTHEQGNGPRQLILITDSSTKNHDLITIFRQWLDAGAIFQPGSQLLLYHRDQSGHQPLFLLEIPAKWGRDARRQRRKYIGQALKLLTETDPEHDPISLPPHSSPRTFPESSTTLRLLLADLTAFVPDRRQQVSHHTLALVDISGSALGPDHARNAVVATFDDFLRRSHCAPESQYTVFLVGKSRDTTRLHFRFSVDPRDPPGLRILRALSARDQLKTLEFPDRRHHSALFQSLHLAVGYLRELPTDSHTLYLISDLRQSDGRYHFASAVPSTKRFLAWLQEQQLLADLSHIPVHIIGLHHTTTGTPGQYTARTNTQIRELWQHALSSMGCPDIRISSSVDTAFPHHQ